MTGDNGSGKSSLLFSLAAPSELLVRHRLAPDMIEFRKEFGASRFVDQDTRLQVIGPTLGNDIEITALIRDMACSQLEAEMTAVWTRVPEFVSRRTGSVSRGELQRFVMAQATSQPPVLLALDEPDGFLDSAGMDILVETVAAIASNRSPSSTVLIATHRRAEWEKRLAHEAWNHIELTRGDPSPALPRPSQRTDAVRASGRLKEGMKVKVGKHSHRLRRDIHLSAHRGTIVAGGNGSGKTSLLRAIANQRDISRQSRFVPDWSADVGDARTVGELRLDPDFRTYLLEHGIHDERPVSYCSWGQRRLLTMFEALSTPCLYYIFDEPFAGLSVQTQQLMASAFVQKTRDGAHVILSSNREDDPTDGMDCFDRIVIDEFLN